MIRSISACETLFDWLGTLRTKTHHSTVIISPKTPAKMKTECQLLKIPKIQPSSGTAKARPKNEPVM